MSWTQPCCGVCWGLRNPDREPHRMRLTTTEQCCHCGMSTNSGIYVRVDPMTVPYPSP